jgi:hypothetical protein
MNRGENFISYARQRTTQVTINDSRDSVTVSDRLTAVSINIFSVTKDIKLILKKYMFAFLMGVISLWLGQRYLLSCLFVCLMVFNAIFNNISVISWRSVLLVEETGVPRENHRPAASYWKTLSHNVAQSNLSQGESYYDLLVYFENKSFNVQDQAHIEQKFKI